MPVNTILGLFAKSPLTPLQEHIRKVHECCTLLRPFFRAVEAGDWNSAAQQQQAIAHLEREADQLKRDIRLKLPRGLFIIISINPVLWHPIPKGC